MSDIMTKLGSFPAELRPVGGYDVDDIVHDCMGVVYKKLRLDINIHDTFQIEKVKGFTPEEQAKIRKTMVDPVSFEQLKFYDGFKEIMRPAIDFKARIVFATNCTSLEIAESKRRQIHAQIEIPDEDILTFLIKPTFEGGITKKPLPPKMLFWVDDGIHNLLDADAEFLISMKKPWNYNETELKRLAGKNVTWFENGDLKGINDFVYDLVLERVKQIAS